MTDPSGRDDLYLGRMRAHPAAEGQRVGRVPVDPVRTRDDPKRPVIGGHALMHHMADSLRHGPRVRWPGK
jgi:hypothetical protein